MSKHMIARCSCGRVELETRGAPILSAACYCDDCQEGSRQIERLPDAPPVKGPDGGTSYLLFRKDRVKCTKGTGHLRDYRIKKASHTRRVVATCCNSAMFLDFQKGHWLSMYRARFGYDAPPLQMRVQMKFKPQCVKSPGDVPGYPGYPPKFMLKLIGAKIAMLLHR